jgi:hypothetical protein
LLNLRLSLTVRFGVGVIQLDNIVFDAKSGEFVLGGGHLGVDADAEFIIPAERVVKDQLPLSADMIIPYFRCNILVSKVILAVAICLLSPFDLKIQCAAV